jgi:hypothetical protein
VLQNRPEEGLNRDGFGVTLDTRPAKPRFRGVFTRVPKLALVAALACSIGLHWAVVQSVAWMGMVVSYAQGGSFGDALAKTFDGNHPCPLCKEIAKGKQSEKKSDLAPAIKKFECCYQAADFVFAPSSIGWETRWPDSWLRSLAHTPPVPPPRQLPG